MDHLWYSQSLEERGYEAFAIALEYGFLTALDIPYWNMARVSLAGEEVLLHYNLAATKQDTYDGWTGVEDRIYLGYGKIVSCRQMKPSEIIARMRELGMAIPSCVLRNPDL